MKQVAIFYTSQVEADISESIEQAGLSLTTDLSLCDGLILVGRQAEKSEEIIEILVQKNLAGIPILGMGAGAEILVKSGLVPGLEGNKAGISLQEQTINSSEESLIHLAAGYQYNAFTRNMDPSMGLLANKVSQCFVIPPALLAEMRNNGLVIFEYADQQIAAISNKAGNIMAMLPCLAFNLGVILKSMREYMLKEIKPRVLPLNYYPRS